MKWRRSQAAWAQAATLAFTNLKTFVQGYSLIFLGCKHGGANEAVVRTK